MQRNRETQSFKGTKQIPTYQSPWLTLQSFQKDCLKNVSGLKDIMEKHKSGK